MTWLGFLNYYILQWFCFRLAKKVDEKGATVGWKILGPVAPRSGWDTPYRWLR